MVLELLRQNYLECLNLRSQMVTLFRDERALDSPEVQAKIERLQNDFPAEVRDLANSLLALGCLAGVANTRILVESLLDRVQAMADMQQ